MSRPGIDWDLVEAAMYRSVRGYPRQNDFELCQAAFTHAPEEYKRRHAAARERAQDDYRSGR